MSVRVLVSPFFLTRYLLRRALREALREAPAHGVLIDVGCGEKPHRDLFTGVARYEGIDFAGFSANKDFSTGVPDYTFPDDYTQTWRLPFSAESYDHAAAFEVLEHHPEPAVALAELGRVVRVGGHIYLSWPFTFPLHEEPHDYSRHTHHAVERLAKAAGLEPLGFWRTGGAVASGVTLLTGNLAMFHDRGGWQRILALLVYPAFLGLQYAALPFSKVADRTVLSYVAVLRKSR
jgi:SAM-dependent methyltransferase